MLNKHAQQYASKKIFRLGKYFTAMKVAVSALTLAAAKTTQPDR